MKLASRYHYGRNGAARNGKRAGFTLAECVIVVIVLGVLAAVAVPQFSSASQDSRSSVLKNQLQEIRRAILLYRGQHMDQLPDLSSGWTPLITRTDAQGGDTGAPLFGPYLRRTPVNALSGGSTVSSSAQPGVDWVWTSSTGTLTALDDQGNSFNEKP
jgi:general secretion pathway protein G